MTKITPKAFIFKLNKSKIFININKVNGGELCDDPGVMFIGILYIAMNLLHTILHCQTPSLSSVSCALVVVAHYLWVSLLAWRSICP